MKIWTDSQEDLRDNNRDKKIGVCRGLAIAKPRLPLTRELSSKARLRERNGCAFMRFHFSPSVFLLTQKATSQLPFRSVLLSLRLEIATGNPHPRQREPRFSYCKTPTNPNLFFKASLFLCKKTETVYNL